MENKVIINIFKKLLNGNNILSIYGKAGTGKSTLALQIVGDFLNESHIDINNNEYAHWLQLSENFSLKRLTHIFAKNKIKLNFLKEHILISPRTPCINYETQCILLRSILSSDLKTPNLSFLILNNISNHLRLEINKCNNNLKKISFLKNDFFQSYIFPLIMKSRRENFILIFIHEVSYIPEVGEKLFNYKMYKQLKSVNIHLKKNNYYNKYYLDLFSNKSKYQIEYLIKNEGFIWKSIKNLSL